MTIRFQYIFTPYDEDSVRGIDRYSECQEFTLEERQACLTRLLAGQALCFENEEQAEYFMGLIKPYLNGLDTLEGLLLRRRGKLVGILQLPENDDVNETLSLWHLFFEHPRSVNKLITKYKPFSMVSASLQDNGTYKVVEKQGFKRNIAVG